MGEMDYVRILRDLREDADKTQTQIAEVLGTSQTMYARYERGANELPIHHYYENLSPSGRSRAARRGFPCRVGSVTFVRR